MKIYGDFKEAFDYDKKINVPKEVKENVLSYMKDFESHQFLLKIAGVQTTYHDGTYFWSTMDIKNLEQDVYGFADGFVEHVLKKLEDETNGKG